MNKNTNRNYRIRFNIISVCVYVIGIILLVQLFNLQIVKGEQYRQQSNTRLSRETTLRAARGEILDSSGNKLATTKMGLVLELYKTKIDNNTFNNTLLKIAQILEKNGDSYIDELPIKVEPFSFTYKTEESQNEWKEDNKIDKNKTAEECFYYLKEKYQINNENIQETRKIMTLRYAIAREGFSSTKSVQLASNISQISLHEFTEQNADFPGINIVETPIRSYPSGTLASHVLGYVGRISGEEYAENKEIYTQNDIIGRTGIEYIFEKYLKGTDGIKQIDMAVDGTITDEYIAQEAIAGNDVVLTIDANLQKVTEQALMNNIQKIASGGFGKTYNANAGSAVVMNVKTGEVLAIASYPDYEPQLFADGISNEKYQEYISEEAHSPLFNRAISSTSSPGSTFKMVTAIAALESGKVTTTERVNDVGIYKFSRDYNPKCWIYSSYGRGHGYLNVSEAIKHSCNYFFYDMGERMGIDTLASYAKYLGLGQKTGIELPSEAVGSVSSKENSQKKGEIFTGGNTLQAAIGQHDNSFTPIQMAKYTSMIANGGKKIDVTIVKTIIDQNGNEVSKEEINKYVNQKLGLTKDTTPEETFKQENVQAILEGMRGVTSESGGTAYQYFRDFNIEIGGKTGSAQTGIAGKTNGWFVGFAPFDDPEIAVVVMVENAGSGGYTAEVARDIIAEYFGMNANKIKEDMTAIPETGVQN
ncbi:MAG: penicillin-binding protein 2 [Clostridia bacterium]|nr:penicillin-binding protein 2 [Clostridia bacterium]